ncbi:2OG-Fe(II) oxygenase [Acanthamoeba polyphaga moumouvirus]|uniref:2OG-Fe(II) oxygenase n=2 Tax=Moumouvirus TaxID=3080801 RepID=L7RBP9_9VIRU|nr:2OG-Fe(II) oxygenase [Acanthamoeba polyphaga moumouvirus]AEX62796.1 putative Fe2OG dioxygenase [Moumouvirus Monve]AGC01949.1 2OG-Fe(II) oxygenase [Acanthamoeba polyphaga moumouvirus]AQN68311.1 2OG-fe(II) oxygenase [Saudi moumouvirus]
MDTKPYKYIPKVLDEDLYDKLVTEIKLKREYIPVTYSTEKIPERRETAWQSNTNISAEYSGKIMNPEPFTPTVLYIKGCVEKIIGVEFDSALIFHYLDGRDSMGYHYDTIGVSRGTDIAGITFGATRKLGIRNNITHEKEFFDLSNGDIFYMFNDCQDKYKHAILPTDSKNINIGPRLAITFRNMAVKKN